MPAEYLDLAYITWQSYRESMGSGWGMVMSASGPPSSGYTPASFSARGQTLTSLAQAMGRQGRANGIRATNQASGYVLIEIGTPHYSASDEVFVSPLNVREQPGQSGTARGAMSVTVEGGGDAVTVSDPTARFPGRQVLQVSGGGSAQFVGASTLRTLSKTATTLQLQANAGLSGIRPGDVVPYIRSDDASGVGQYVRVVSIVVDEQALPSTFSMTVQVIEPRAADPVTLTGGAYWPGTRSTGNPIMRRFRDIGR